MTAKVTSLSDRLAAKAQEELDDKTCRGEAVCLFCEHKWHAVAPIGTTWLECPRCSRFFGRHAGASERSGEHWTCLCGSDVWRIQLDGAYCVDCGAWSTDWKR